MGDNMVDVAENLTQFKTDLPDHVTLVAVSKTKPVSAIESAYATGHRDFGENKVQEMVSKAEALPKDIHWHLIGHLQRNKVKYIAPFVHLIHAVDSFKLAKEINKRAKQNNRTIDCLLQIHIADETSKFGLNYDEAEALLKGEELAALDNISIKGLMGMATFTEDQEQIKREFKGLEAFYERMKNATASLANCSFETLSMGMSGDYALAIECGSNMVRIGSTLFGARN